jgi:hypothetical protein
VDALSPALRRDRPREVPANRRLNVLRHTDSGAGRSLQEDFRQPFPLLRDRFRSAALTEAPWDLRAVVLSIAAVCLDRFVPRR